jgi:hypothetical protein
VDVFGRHGEEAFSGLRIENYRHSLRLHIDRQGTLTIWPLEIECVPRRWCARRADDVTASRYVPDEPMTAELIEPPIVVW